MNNIIFFGPPGAGKGTQAKIISKYLNLPHLSTGDILRDKINQKDDLAIELQKIMSSGKLVSDDILNKIIGQKLTSKDCFNGFILDGYPRTTNQSNFFLSFLNQKNLHLDFIFDFKIDVNLVQERILFRSQQEKRSDDNLTTIKTRIDKYMKETFPVSEYFRHKFENNYFELDASEEISKIQKELIKILKKEEN